MVPQGCMVKEGIKMEIGITLEQFEAIRGLVEVYVNCNVKVINKIPNESARFSAIASLYTLRFRTIDALEENVDIRRIVDDTAMWFACESVKYCIKAVEEKVETSPDCDRKALLDAVEEYKALLEAIRALFSKW